MGKFTTILLVLIILISTTMSFAQISRRSQIELYSGFAFPQEPENFKDYWKVGLSLNAQYVFFPSSRWGIPIFIGVEGFTVNQDAINSSFNDALVGFRIYDNLTPVAQITEANVETEGSAGDFKFGIGLRPYLTSPESSVQFFLFGNVAYNIISITTEFKNATITYRDLVTDQSGNTSLTARELEVQDFETKNETSEGKVGLGFGLGVELPAGGSINLIIQGLANIIFTDYEELSRNDDEKKHLSFIGLTFGIAF